MKAKELKRLLKDIPDNMDVVVHCTGAPVVSEIMSCYGGDTKSYPVTITVCHIPYMYLRL